MHILVHKTHYMLVKIFFYEERIEFFTLQHTKITLSVQDRSET
jgi:hypothetical protein